MAFIVTYEQIESSGRVGPTSIGLKTAHNSVLFKLHSAKRHLDAILSTKNWAIPMLSNAASGMTINTGSPLTSVPQLPVSPTALQLSGDIDDFFGNIASAFDYFSQIVNVVYFPNPLAETDATFNWINRLMKIQRLNANITTHLSSIRQTQWYVDMNVFRRRAIHVGIIVCQVVTTQSFTQTSPYSLTKINLPDNPFGNQPTYQKNRDMTFVENIFRSALDALDQAFDLMNDDVKASNRIPI